MPFIWSDPRAADQRRAPMPSASTMDIPATVLDRAKIAPYVGMQGLSVLPAVLKAARRCRTRLLIQYEHQAANAKTGRPPRVHSLVDGRWRLSIFEGEDWGELYDLEKDPGEFDNLWDSADHAAVRAQLMERIRRPKSPMSTWCRCRHDGRKRFL